jgi:hypothetical protein
LGGILSVLSVNEYSRFHPLLLIENFQPKLDSPQNSTPHDSPPNQAISSEIFCILFSFPLRPLYKMWKNRFFLPYSLPIYPFIYLSIFTLIDYASCLCFCWDENWLWFCWDESNQFYQTLWKSKRTEVIIFIFCLVLFCSWNISNFYLFYFLLYGRREDQLKLVKFGYLLGFGSVVQMKNR